MKCLVWGRFHVAFLGLEPLLSLSLCVCVYRPRQVFRVTQVKHVSNPTWAGFWAQGGCSELGSGLSYRTQLGFG
jgi:hypothetical protein